MFDRTEQFSRGWIINYHCDPSEKWLALIIDCRYLKHFDREMHRGDPPLSMMQLFSVEQQRSQIFRAHAAAFTTLNVEGKDTPSTLLCYAQGIGRNENKHLIQLSVSDALVAEPGKPFFAKKNVGYFSVPSAAVPKAVQISQKYGLIYVITVRGLISVHDLETAEAICSHNISDDDDVIIRLTECTSSESFYTVNGRGQVLLTNVNDSTLLSFLYGKLQVTRGKLQDFQKLRQQMVNEIEGKTNVELQNDYAKTIKDLEESLQLEKKLRRETEEQLTSMTTKINSHQMLEQQMLNEMIGLKMQYAEQQNEKDSIVSNLHKSLQIEKRRTEETEEQLARTRREVKILQELNQELQNKIEELNKESAKLLDERNKIVTLMEESQQLEKKVRREIEEQLACKMMEINNYQQSQKEMQNETEKSKQQNTWLTQEKDKIVVHMAESLQVETKGWEEIKEQLSNKMNELNNYRMSQQEMQNEIVGLKNRNSDLTKERDQIIKTIEDLRLYIEGFASTNHLEPNFIEFTDAELRELTNDFSDSLKIGEGGYGSVYKALLGLKPVAIKILKHESHHGSREFNQEVKILSRVRHPTLVMLLGACLEAQALVYELMPNGSLFDILRNKQQSRALTWKIRICIASNICSALIVLHSTKPHGIVHGDLKSANILLDSNYSAKLSDFGICRHLRQTDIRMTPHHYTNYPKGTLPYMAPEYLDTGEMTAQYDVYSFGIVLLELVTGRCPMVGFRKSVEAALQKGENLVDTSAGEWPFEEAKRMIVLGLQCCDPARENRPDLEKVVCIEIDSMRRSSLCF